MPVWDFLSMCRASQVTALAVPVWTGVSCLTKLLKAVPSPKLMPRPSFAKLPRRLRTCTPKRFHTGSPRCGVECCWGNALMGNMYHRDLKPENILLKKILHRVPGNPEPVVKWLAKISDFGRLGLLMHCSIAPVLLVCLQECPVL